jgi:hypothetical protein
LAGGIAVTPQPVLSESDIRDRVINWTEDSIGATPGETAGDEKPVTPKVPATGMPTENSTPATTTPTQNATASSEPTATATTDIDDSDDEEPEETTAATPTLEREAPPRPNATLAKSHQSHDRPLVQSDHQLITPASPIPPGENQTGASPAVTVPQEGLIVRGVGVLLPRTPEDVALTRNGVEIANLDWLLDPVMHLGGRHPRAAFEGEPFTVTVTVEARNVTLTGESPAYVVLVPPPAGTGVYEVTRTREPGGLRDGERAVWEFSVVTRTGRLTLANLTLSEERQVTDLTSNPEFFAFRAYAFTSGQEYPSVGLSDPVLAIRPSGNTTVIEESSLPALYTRAGIQNLALRPSETMTGAWDRGVDHNALVTEAAGHLDTIRALGKEEVTALYAEEGTGGRETGADVPAASSSVSSPLDLIAGFFRGLFGWFGETAQDGSP